MGTPGLQAADSLGDGHFSLASPVGMSGMILVPNHPSGFIGVLVVKLTFVSCAPPVIAR